MMPAKFNLYSAWIDPYFYVWAAVFAGALFTMVYAIRRYLELKNAAPFEEEESAAAENPFLEEPAPAPAPAPAAEEPADAEKTLVVPPPFQPELPAEEPAPEAEPVQQPVLPAAGQAPEPAPRAAAAASSGQDDHTRAEHFVRGIYAGITDLDERMKGIEEALSKSRVNGDFAVKFLEDVLQDIDTLDKAKIRARLEYLISDLKK